MKTFIIGILFTSVFFIGCKKNSIGGKSYLNGQVTHHGVAIPNAYIYIKYNSTEFPGDDYNLYDTYIIADNNGNFNMNFFKGKYYIYARGYDLNINPPYIVKGGFSVTLRDREKISRNIAVTE